MQVALHLAAVAQREDDFLRFAAAIAARRFKCQCDPFGVGGADVGHEGHQQPVMLHRLKGVMRHGIRLDDHVVLIQHQQRQGDAGKQRLKALGGAFGHGLAVVQYLVLDFQLVLVIAQFGNQCGQWVVVGGVIRQGERWQPIQRC